jgi:hypothetical protein
MINAAAVLLSTAIGSLTGVEAEADVASAAEEASAEATPIIPGASIADDATVIAQAEAAAAETANAKAARERRLRLAEAA